MNVIVEKILAEKTQLIDRYIENMKYVDIIGIPDKDWNRIMKIKKDIEDKIAKEKSKIDIANAALEAKISQIPEDDAKRSAKIDKLTIANSAKIIKINEKITSLELELAEFPKSRIFVNKTDTVVRAADMKPEFIKFAESHKVEVKTKYGIE